jgi:gliding motility-associated-like protein
MLKRTLVIISLVFFTFCSYAQIVTQCPQNIGFEAGSFNHWECSTGIIGGRTHSTLSTGEIFITGTNRIPGRHDVIKKGSGTDLFGDFSLDSPNGSDYVVKIGNDVGGAQVDRISYIVNVPGDVDTYSIIFNYAVVFESPTHEQAEQPKFTAKIFDVTTNSSTSCGSFDFIAPRNGDGLPGFIESDIQKVPNAAILYKPWSPVLVNLTEYRGHTIRLEFTVNDCTFMQHFGYAYIDVNENCSIPITGNVTCPEATSLTLKMLPGFAKYTWFLPDADEQVLSETDSLVLNPIPPIGTRVGVRLVPFDGLGCTQILFTSITGIAMQVHDPPPDCISVDLTATSVTVGNASDLTYTYWMDAAATRRVTDPRHVAVEGVYYIRGRSSSGCTIVKAVTVTIVRPADMGIKNPEPVTYPVTADITRSFTHLEGMTYTYWMDKDAKFELKNPASIKISGRYYIKVVDPMGCIRISPVDARVIITDVIVNNTFTPNGDGTNDVFTVLINDKVKLKYFRVYNRYGNIVYQTTDITNYWGGFSQNKEVPVGVYYWAIEGVLDGNPYTRSGYITVLR